MALTDSEETGIVVAIGCAVVLCCAVAVWRVVDERRRGLAAQREVERPPMAAPLLPAAAGGAPDASAGAAAADPPSAPVYQREDTEPEACVTGPTADPPPAAQKPEHSAPPGPAAAELPAQPPAGEAPARAPSRPGDNTEADGDAQQGRRSQLRRSESASAAQLRRGGRDSAAAAAGRGGAGDGSGAAPTRGRGSPSAVRERAVPPLRALVGPYALSEDDVFHTRSAGQVFHDTGSSKAGAAEIADHSRRLSPPRPSPARPSPPRPPAPRPPPGIPEPGALDVAVHHSDGKGLLGLQFDDDGVLRAVGAGTAAEAAGVGACVGRALTHVNSRELRGPAPAALAAAAAAGPAVALRFAAPPPRRPPVWQSAADAWWAPCARDDAPPRSRLSAHSAPPPGLFSPGGTSIRSGLLTPGRPSGSGRGAPGA